MAYFNRKIRHTGFSPGRLALDKSHWLHKNIVTACFLNQANPVDLVSGNPIILGNSATYSGAEQKQKVLRTVKESNQFGRVKPSQKLYDVDDVTMFWFGSIESMDAWMGLIAVPYRASGWTSPYLALGFARESSTDVGKVHHSNAGSSVSEKSASGYLLADGEYHCYSVTMSFTGDYTNFYRDGILHSTDGTVAGSVLDWGENKEVAIGQGDYQGNDTSGITGNSAIALIIKGNLSSSQHAAIAKNPYQLLAPISAPIHIEAAAAADPDFLPYYHNSKYNVKLRM